MFDLEACLRGQKAAWDAFVDRFAPVIFSAVQRTLRLRIREVQEAELQDVAQEVFLRLLKDDYRLLRTYDPAKASLPTWLTIVARSVAVDHMRRRRQTVPLEGLEPQSVQPPERPGPDPAALEVPPGLLSPRQRLVLRCLFDQEMSVAEVAHLLGVNAQTVRSTKHKAIQKLRDFFGAR